MFPQQALVRAMIPLALWQAIGLRLDYFQLVLLVILAQEMRQAIFTTPCLKLQRQLNQQPQDTTLQLVPLLLQEALELTGQEPYLKRQVEISSSGQAVI